MYALLNGTIIDGEGGREITCLNGSRRWTFETSFSMEMYQLLAWSQYHLPSASPIDVDFEDPLFVKLNSPPAESCSELGNGSAYPF